MTSNLISQWYSTLQPAASVAHMSSTEPTTSPQQSAMATARIAASDEMFVAGSPTNPGSHALCEASTLIETI